MSDMTNPADFDLDAYLARIGLKQAPDADWGGMDFLQRQHRLTIPFENLDIALGRGISLDPDHVFAKLVHHRRGGYCFEQNQLFLRALQAIGFDARPILARVWLRTEGLPPRTHTANLVEVGGQTWLADAGFGGGYSPPMPLSDGAETPGPDGALFRMRLDADHGWTLERLAPDADRAGGWERQYSFTTDRVFPADLEMSNHWTATRPDTRFTSQTIVSLVLPSGFASLVDRRYVRHTAKEQVESEIESAKAYRLRLNFVFGLILDEVEVMGLGLF